MFVLTTIPLKFKKFNSFYIDLRLQSYSLTHFNGLIAKNPVLVQSIVPHAMFCPPENLSDTVFCPFPVKTLVSAGVTVQFHFCGFLQ